MPTSSRTERATNTTKSRTPRQLTVLCIYRLRNRSSGKLHVVPFLRLSGEWLRQAGFEKGGRVHITAERRKLTIETTQAARRRYT
jgi:cell division inhibitor SulA